MATTNDVTLRLKAQLDLSEVKQRIEELRKYQTPSYASSNNAQGTVVNGGSHTGLNIEQSVNRVVTAIAKLTETLNRLNVTNSQVKTATGGQSSAKGSSFSVGGDRGEADLGLKKELRDAANLAKTKLNVVKDIYKNNPDFLIQKAAKEDIEKLVQKRNAAVQELNNQKLPIEEQRKRFRQINEDYNIDFLNAKKNAKINVESGIKAAEDELNSLDKHVLKKNEKLNDDLTFFNSLDGISKALYEGKIGASEFANNIKRLGTSESFKNIRKSMDELNYRFTLGAISKKEYIKQMKKLANDPSMPYVQNMRTGMGLWMGGMMIDQMAGMIGTDREKVGGTRAAIGQGLQNAASGVSMASYLGSSLPILFPNISKGMVGSAMIGSAAGGAVASLITLIGNLRTEKVLDRVKPIRRFNDSFESVRDIMDDYNDKKFVEKLGNMGLDDLVLNRNEQTKRFKKIQSEYDNIPELEKQSLRLVTEMLRAQDDLRKAEESGKNVRYRQDIISQIANEQENLEAQIKDTIEEYEKQNTRMKNLNDAYDRYIKAIDNLEAITKNAEKFDRSVRDFNQGRVINKLIKEGRTGDLTNQRNDIQSQINEVSGKFSIIQKMGGLAQYEEITNKFRQRFITSSDADERSSLKDIIRRREKLSESYKENAEEIMKLTQKMDSLDNSIEQIKEVSKNLSQSADSIIKTYSDKDEAESLKYRLYRIQYGSDGRDLRKAPMLQFRESSKLLDHYRELMRAKEKESISLAQKSQDDNLTLKEREDLLEQSENAKNEASRFSSLAGQVENFISGINTNIQKPDMSNVTSIGQYGFGMGEVNDNMSRMQRYYDTMEDLTREIRNKLNDGIDTITTYN